MSGIIKSKIISQFPELIHGISTKGYGNMNLSAVHDLEQAIINRKKFCQGLNISVDRLVSVEQVHGGDIIIAGEKDTGKITNLPKADGLITNQKNIFLIVTGADCPPVLFYDHVKQVVGIVHAGWRGILAGVVENMIGSLQDKYSCEVDQVFVFIGPCIGSCHFEVQKDVLSQFRPQYAQFIRVQEEKSYLDLKSIIKHILLKNKLKNDNIEVSLDCTFCRDDLYSSYRREGNSFQPMGAVIGRR
jgi:hypothetical protein